MSHACYGASKGQATPRDVAAPGGGATAKLRAADRLALAASPTFAAMALLTVLLEGDPALALCSGTPGWPLSGMATMYLLMSAFHAAPWLNLIRGRHRPA
jgi:hypothetical protein